VAVGGERELAEGAAPAGGFELGQGGPAPRLPLGAGDQHPRRTGPLSGLPALLDRGVRAEHGLGLQVEPGGGEEGQPADPPVEAEEALHVVVGRGAEQALRRVDLGDLPVRVPDGDHVSHLDRLLDVVGDEHHGLVQLALQTGQLVLQGGPDDRVDGAEWLVHEQHGRVGGEGAGHPDPLLLAAGQLIWVAPAHVLIQADQVHQFPGPVPGLGLGPPVEQRDGGDVVLDRAVREQAGLLNDVADPPPQLGRPRLRDVLAVQQDPALGRVNEPVDHPQRRGLAAAAGPDQDHGLAVRDLQVQPVDRNRPAWITLRHALEGDQAWASLVVSSRPR